MNIAGIVLLIAGRKKFSLPSLPGEIEPGNEQKLLFSPASCSFSYFASSSFFFFSCEGRNVPPFAAGKCHLRIRT